MPRDRTRTNASAHLWIAIIGSIAIIVIAITAKVPTYHVSPVFLVPLLWLGYLLRNKFAITSFSYAAFFLAILLHDLGAYGFYQDSPLGFSWDILVHYYFAIPAALIFRGALAHHFPMLRPWQLNVTTLLFIMGVGALHEIMEYCSYLLLGEEKGMLKPKTSYFFDTQRDLTNNLLGCLTALIGRTIFDRFNSNDREESRRGFEVSVRNAPEQERQDQQR
ncbi:MAG: DUF2238 domain-containing protein [Anaerolineae bacterium]|nr:DUF2238 domain-containing protein [Phycisphaerae bacterium]